MKGISSVGDFFALDIGTTAVRVVQLTRSGNLWTLSKFANVPVDIKISTSDSPEDQRRLAEVITSAIGQSGVRTRNVVIGVPSSRMFATIVELPQMTPAALAGTIKYQAEQFIPTNIEESKIDWAVVGKSPKDPTLDEVLIASVANSFTEQRLDLIEGLGLNVIAIEPDALALCRAYLKEESQDAHVIIDVGDFASDVIITIGDTPRLIRSLPTGFSTLAKAASQNLIVDEKQSAQFILKFGLDESKLEGQVVKALASTIDQFSAELTKSINFFQNKYTDKPITNIVYSGYASTIPMFGSYISKHTEIATGEQATPWHDVEVSVNAQESLKDITSHFAVAVGLAKRKNI